MTQYRLFNGDEVVELVDMPESGANHVVRRLGASVARPVHPDQLSLPSSLDLQAHGLLDGEIREGAYVALDREPVLLKVEYVCPASDGINMMVGLEDGTEHCSFEVELASPRQLKDAGIIEKEPLTFG